MSEVPVLKMLLIGDSAVGKTCLLRRFVEDLFDTSFLPTIGIDFKVRQVNIDGHKVKLQIVCLPVPCENNLHGDSGIRLAKNATRTSLALITEVPLALC